MKKTLVALFALISISFAAKAQYTSITFNNNTSEDVYVQVGGNTSGSACSPDYTDAFLIPPGTSTFSDASQLSMYNNTTTSYLNSGDEFHVVTIYDRAPSCGTGASVELSFCYGASIITGNIDIYSAPLSATPCTRSFTNIQVSIAGSSGTDMIVDIN